MSVVLLSESRPKAKKDHDCIACEFIRESLNQGYFTFEQYREIVKAKRNGWKIKKGNIYLRQNCVSDGHVYTFKAIPEMAELCSELDLYPEV